MRPDARAVTKRALAALAAHLALLALWPLLRPGYAPAFRALARFAMTVVDPLPGAVVVSFRPGSGGQLAGDVVRMDTVAHFRHRDLAGEVDSFGVSSFYHGYLPTSVVLALFAAATPLAWRRRRAPFLWALVLLHVFLGARCIVAVYYAYSKCSIDGQPLLELGPAAARALFLARHFAFHEMWTNYLVPLVIWGLCAFGPRSRASAEGC
jgi:hypothetical protein